jgi:hypothetical protein
VFFHPLDDSDMREAERATTLKDQAKLAFLVGSWSGDALWVRVGCCNDKGAEQK